MMMSFDIVTDTLVVACFDGHGEQGDLVAQFLRDKLTEQLICHPHFSSDLQLALKETIKSAERLLLQRYYRNCSFSGSTMALCAIRDSKIVTANIGDSRVVLCSNGVASALTTDHKADLPEERRRITSAGGRVIVRTYDDGYSGPARVYLAHADIPGLAMSRSLGDYISHEVGVSSEPDVIERDITSQDQFLIIATDGLWDFTTNQEAANITLSCASADAAVSAMIQKSYTKWSSKVGCVMDDTSAIVVFLHQGTY
jgi:serine/threonine protein phosphatase PrpC